MTLLAHAGHWLTNVLYMAPVVAFGIWMGITTIRDKRAARKAAASGREPPEAKSRPPSPPPTQGPSR